MSNATSVVCCALLSLTAFAMQRGGDRYPGAGGEVLRVQTLEIVNEAGDVVMRLEGSALGSALRMRPARTSDDPTVPTPWAIELTADTTCPSRVTLGGAPSDGEPGPTFAFGLEGKPLAPWLTVVDQDGQERVSLRTRLGAQRPEPTLRVHGPDGMSALESDDDSSRVFDVLRAKRIEVVSDERRPAILLEAAQGLASIKLRSGIRGATEEYACGLWTSFANESSMWFFDPRMPVGARAGVFMGVDMGEPARGSLVVTDTGGKKLLDVGSK